MCLFVGDPTGFDDVLYIELKEILKARVDVIYFFEQFSLICLADHRLITTEGNTNLYYPIYLNLSNGRFFFKIIELHLLMFLLPFDRLGLHTKY